MQQQKIAAIVRRRIERRSKMKPLNMMNEDSRRRHFLRCWERWIKKNRRHARCWILNDGEDTVSSFIDKRMLAEDAKEYFFHACSLMRHMRSVLK